MDGRCVTVWICTAAAGATGRKCKERVAGVRQTTRAAVAAAAAEAAARRAADRRGEAAQQGCKKARRGGVEGERRGWRKRIRGADGGGMACWEVEGGEGGDEQRVSGGRRHSLEGGRGCDVSVKRRWGGTVPGRGWSVGILYNIGVQQSDPYCVCAFVTLQG